MVVGQSKGAFNNSLIKKNIAMICTHFSYIPEKIKKLETHGLTLTEAIQTMSKIRQMNSTLPNSKKSLKTF